MRKGGYRGRGRDSRSAVEWGIEERAGIQEVQ